MNQPTSGGQYVRDPETGAITKVTEAPAGASAVVIQTETTPPVEKTAPGKGRRNV